MKRDTLATGKRPGGAGSAVTARTSGRIGRERMGERMRGTERRDLCMKQSQDSSVGLPNGRPFRRSERPDTRAL